MPRHIRVSGPDEPSWNGLVKYAKAMGNPVSEDPSREEQVRWLRQIFRLDVNEQDLAE